MIWHLTKTMMQSSKVILTLLLLCVPSLASAEISITNLDKIGYDIQAEIGGAPTTISIEPGMTWSTDNYPVVVKMGKTRARLDMNSAYAIWEGGALTKQRDSSRIGR